MDNNKIVLKTPVTLTIGNEDRQVTELIFRAPKAKDLRIRDRASGDVDAVIRLIATLTGEDIKVIDELSADDFAAAAEIVASFMETSPKTGAT